MDDATKILLLHFSLLLIAFISINCEKYDELAWTCGNRISYDGKSYNTVQIGNQCWLRENLDVGMMIDSLQNQNENDTIEKYCYNNNQTNCNIYGGLYQWNEAMQYANAAGSQGICPPGWHIPTQGEFVTLFTTVGHDGNSLKAIGQVGGRNTSGFSALLTGFRDIYQGDFHGLGEQTLFWSSTEYESSQGYLMYLNRDSYIGLYWYFSKNGGCSVRCLKD